MCKVFYLLLLFIFETCEAKVAHRTGFAQHIKYQYSVCANKMQKGIHKFAKQTFKNEKWFTCIVNFVFEKLANKIANETSFNIIL